MDGSLFMPSCGVQCDARVGFLSHGGEKKIKTALQTVYTSLLLNAEDGRGAECGISVVSHTHRADVGKGTGWGLPDKST